MQTKGQWICVSVWILTQRICGALYKTNPHHADTDASPVLLSLQLYMWSVQCLTTDGEQGEGLCLLCRSDTLQGVVLSELFADIQSAFHLTPTKGWLWKDSDLRGLPLGGIGQLWAPVETLRLLKITPCKSRFQPLQINLLIQCLWIHSSRRGRKSKT